MRRPSLWLLLVVLLLGILILRDPRLRRVDDDLLAWFIQRTPAKLLPAPVTQVEIGREDFQSLIPSEERKPLPGGEAIRRSLSPLEYALFLQAALEFQPAVIGIEPLLIWRSRDKIQEQVLIDQAMRVPKLLVSLKLGGKGERDLSPDELPTMANVTGHRGDLASFNGISHQPDDDIRLISTPGFINLPDESSDPIRVPMLFEYEGEIVPSFTLEAIMLWLRATPADVKVVLGSEIILPNGWKIPLHRDGTTTINPAARQSVHRLTLGELLLAAQEREQHRPPTREIGNLKNQIVLLRLVGDPLQPANVFATAIATIQNNAYVRPVSAKVSWLMIFIGLLLASFDRMISRSNFFLGAILLTAAYAMMELVFLSYQRIWLPWLLPMGLLWFLVIARLFDRERVVNRNISAA
jgi:hypothetical protein